MYGKSGDIYIALTISGSPQKRGILNKMIPIFIITCDRLKVLEQSIQSYYDCIKTPFEIVIIDYGSTFMPTIKYLKILEDKKIKVYWKERLRLARTLNHNDAIIQDYFKTHPRSNYVVTDPDISLDNVRGDVLEVYAHLLENLPVDVVGPMLKIDDIPDCYPRKEELLSNSEHAWFHSIPTAIIKYKNRNIEFIPTPIDTTFAMSRAGSHWKRKMKGARVLPPYAARHLDWYLDPKNLTPDQIYYMEHASRKTAHWSMGILDK